MLNPSSDGRLIPGFSGYCVTSDGKVWSCRKSAGRRGGHYLSSEWREVKGSSTRGGYLQVHICADDGSRACPYVHRLVLEAFSGECPDGMECCHGDGNPINNKLENLRWDTPKGNWVDRRRHGRDHSCPGESHPNAKLTSRKVRLIREDIQRGVPQRQIAKTHGVHQATISQIATGKTWKGGVSHGN